MTASTTAIPAMPGSPGYKPWGQLTIVGLYGCDPDVVRSEAALRAFLLDLVPGIGMVANGEPILGEKRVDQFGKGDLHGWTALQAIETSSICVHLDPVGHRVFVDAFSCQDFDEHDAARIAQRYFGGTVSVESRDR